MCIPGHARNCLFRIRPGVGASVGSPDSESEPVASLELESDSKQHHHDSETLDAVRHATPKCYFCVSKGTE